VEILSNRMQIMENNCILLLKTDNHIFVWFYTSKVNQQQSQVYVPQLLTSSIKWNYNSKKQLAV